MKEFSDRPLRIWGFAFGYFACYVPYSALTRALSSGLLPHLPRRVPGLELLPLSVFASCVAAVVFLTWARWWRFAGTREVLGLRIPFPNAWTALSGLCASGILLTTTLAYSFAGLSIVFMMLLMRGGVLMLAPLVDRLGNRKVRPSSWIALGLSVAAVFCAVGSPGNVGLTVVASADVGLYLLAYFFRLRAMTHLAKSSDDDQRRRYFVEEQLVAAPAALLALVLLAVVAPLPELRAAFTAASLRELGWVGVTIGVLSQGTGIFGALVLLEARENSFCVPVNRASSVLAGMVASVLLPGTLPAAGWVGAGLLILALVTLGVPSVLAARRTPTLPVPAPR